MAASNPPAHRFLGKFAVDTAGGSFVGERRIALLEAIGRHGSISAAARSIPLSYKAAWDAVEAMNNLGDEPLVLRTTGGSHGGGAVLTAYGREVVALFRAIEAQYAASLDRAFRGLHENSAPPHGDLRRTIRRLAVTTSARNQFQGRVAAVRRIPAGTEVRIAIDEGQEISSIVTRESVANLGISVGAGIQALVKASSVRLRVPRKPGTHRINELQGRVARLNRGAGPAELAIDLPGGRTVTALVERRFVERLGLARGSACTAVIDPASVILIRLD